MREMIPFLKENDRDNKELKSFKQFITKITGIEEVEGETITDVINNYSGESGGSFEPTILYGKINYLDNNEQLEQVYHDKDCTNIVTYEDAIDFKEKGAPIVVCTGSNYYYYITEVSSSMNYDLYVSMYKFYSGNKVWWSEQKQ